MEDYILTPEADGDLENITQYTRSRWGERQLKRYLTALEKGILALIGGHIKYKEIVAPPYFLRMAHIEHHYVFLRMCENAPAAVEAIFYGRMDYMNQLSKRFRS